MDVEEALFLEEIVDRAADAVPHPGDGAEGVGPRPQVGDGAEELKGMLLLLQRIGFGIGPAVYGDAAGLDFGGLALAGRRLQQPADADAATGGEPLDFRFVVGQGGLGHHLDVAETRAVVEFDKAEAGLRVAAGAHPALQKGLAADHLGLPRLSDRKFFHRLRLVAHSSTSSFTETLPLLTAADHCQDHLLAGLLALHRVEKIVAAADGLAVDRHDQVGGGPVDRLKLVNDGALPPLLPHDLGPLQPGALRRPPRRQRFDQQPLVGLIHPADPHLGPADPAVGDQLRDDPRDGIDGNGETHPHALARAAGDGRVHADHAAMAVQQRPAGIARVDCRVDLNDRLDRTTALPAGQRAIQAGDDAGA